MAEDRSFIEASIEEQMRELDRVMKENPQLAEMYKGVLDEKELRRLFLTTPQGKG